MTNFCHKAMKKHAPRFLKAINARSIDDAALHRMQWGDLQKAKLSVVRVFGTEGGLN
jgi:hypothetical protein